VNAVAVTELEGRPIVISGGDDGVRVWDLATGAPVGDPLSDLHGHGGQADWLGLADSVNAVAAMELEGRPVVISGADDGSVRVWDLARQRAVRHHWRDVRLRNAAPVRAAVLIQRENRVNVVIGCADGVSQTWDLSAYRMSSRTITQGPSGVSAIATLVPDQVLYATGRTIALYKPANAAAPVLTIELDSEIQALAAHGSLTVVGATKLGLITLEVPH
jgi:WD40 repeat protein